MSENKDEGVVVVRRRRKIIRHQREKTPEPTIKSGIKPKYSDDESSSAAERYVDTVTLKIPSTTIGKTTSTPKTSSSPPTQVKGSSHRSKILSRRDKAVGTSAVRSQSTPRDENKSSSPPLVSILRQPKRSLSSPRYIFYTEKMFFRI